MTLPALAVLFAGLAAAQARTAPEGPDARPVDPASLSPAARAAFEDDPAAFREEHADDLETLRRWSRDPSLGRKECAEAGQDPRSCMEGRLQGLSQVATPQALAVVNSYVKLLPRGVSAEVPRMDAAGGASGAPPAPAPQPPAAAMSGRASDFKGGPNTLTVSAVPALRVPAASPAPAETPWWEDQYNFYLCFYVPSKCPTQ